MISKAGLRTIGDLARVETRVPGVGTGIWGALKMAARRVVDSGHQARAPSVYAARTHEPHAPGRRHLAVSGQPGCLPREAVLGPTERSRSRLSTLLGSARTRHSPHTKGERA